MQQKNKTATTNARLIMTTPCSKVRYRSTGADVSIPGRASTNKLSHLPRRGGSISQWIRAATFTLPQLGVIAACVVDVCTRTRRDWAHWVGAICFLSAGAIAWTWQIWMMLVPPAR
jgi:hypothetical protein